MTPPTHKYHTHIPHTANHTTHHTSYTTHHTPHIAHHTPHARTHTYTHIHSHKLTRARSHAPHATFAANATLPTGAAPDPGDDRIVEIQSVAGTLRRVDREPPSGVSIPANPALPTLESSGDATSTNEADPPPLD